MKCNLKKPKTSQVTKAYKKTVVSDKENVCSVIRREKCQFYHLFKSHSRMLGSSWDSCKSQLF